MRVFSENKSFFVGTGLILAYILLGKFLDPWDVLLLPIAILPNFIFNVVVNCQNLDLLNVYYLRVVTLYRLEVLLFILLGGLFYYISWKGLFGKNKFYRNTILIVYFLFFMRIILFEVKSFIPPTFPLTPEEVILTNYGLTTFLRVIVSVLCIVCILSFFHNRFNFRNLLRLLIHYFYVIFVMLLGLYIVLALIKWRAGTNMNYEYLLMAKISIFILGFPLFLILKMIKDFIIKCLERK